MDKLKFEALGPDEKINFMNDSLKNGSTLTSISDEILISRKTIAKKLKILGYKYHMQQRQFIKDIEYKYNTSILDLVKNPITKAIKPHEYKPNTNIFNTKDAENKILDIIEKHDNIQEMLEWYNNQRKGGVTSALFNKKA